jgi:hypothetical protein
MHTREIPLYSKIYSRITKREGVRANNISI